MYSILVLSIFFLSVYSVTEEPLLIIVSYDAFRYNYFEKNITPFLSKLKKEGTTADYLKNVFPTKTFPNHHTIVTGLYPEVHGVVGNTVYDDKYKALLHVDDERMYNYSEDFVPIWILNQLAGKNRISGSMMWPGGRFTYKNTKAHYVAVWDPNVAWEKRVDTIITWMTSKTKPANLIMFYIEEPDTHGHAFGPNSQIVNDIISKLDNTTKYLYDKLRENGLLEKANVVHISDHGMSVVKPPNFINITKDLIPDTYINADTSPCLQFFAKEGFDENDMYMRLKNASLSNRNYKIYRKKDLLDRWHFKNNRRIPPVLAVAEPGYGFQDLATSAEYYSEKYNFKVTPQSEFGVHGYDNEVRDMHPFFIAYGPNIKSSHKVPPFSTLDLYSLFCAVLQIEPQKNNGTYANVRDILIPAKPNIVSPFLIAVGGCIISFSIIGCAVAISLLIRRKRFRTDYPTTFGKILQNNRNVVEAQHLLESEEI